MTGLETLTSAARQWLLGRARAAIVARIGDVLLGHGVEVAPGTDLLAQVSAGRGCFVSLHRRDGALRGCIGTFDATTALRHNVERMAVAAATADPRFPALRRGELGECQIEISALTLPRSIALADIEVGVHGLQVSRGARRGVLLPQVAVEHAWDRETFLAHSCLKAGLPPEAWRDVSTCVEAFTAEVFGEPVPS